MHLLDPDAERRQRDRLQQLASRLSDEQLRTDLGGGWTVAVALAHMAFWDRRVVAQLERWRSLGRGPGPQDEFDSVVINDAALAQWQALPPRAAANEALAAAEAADQAVAQADSAVLQHVIAQKGPFSLPRAIHREEHLDQIERALSS
jgi:hypothetical protein